jgi:uncharacterized protein YkwD
MILPATHASAGGGCPNAAATPASLAAEQAGAAVACEINQRRKKKGLRALRPQVRLVQAATQHSTDMVSNGFFSHISLDGISIVGRILETGYQTGASTWSVGENLHWGTGVQGTPRAVVAMWMKSPLHRRNILYRRWRHVGIGVTKGSPYDPASADSATYTVNFGYRRA